jgi:hypothetical protein
MTTPLPEVDATVDTGDRNQPVATVTAGPITVTVYASLMAEPGKVVIEIDGDTSSARLYVNDGQLLPGVTIAREQLEAWAGRPLSDDEVQRVADSLPNASVPEAIATIVDSLTEGDE